MTLTNPPTGFADEKSLLEHLTRPRKVLVEFVRQLSSPLLILGASGKMGPTLAVLARRAADQAGHPLDVIAASRFSDPHARKWLEERGVKTLHADLLDRNAVEQLPATENILYMVGMKFGTSKKPEWTWATNALAPIHVCERYPKARIVALSTGNVYPNVEVSGPGAGEQHSLTPLGEYPNAAVARERLFQYFSTRNQTPIALLRLSYAVELRYGVLVDIARAVWENRPISLTNPYVNWIWQGDANEFVIRSLSLASTPASCWNLTHPNRIRVREAAEGFAGMLARNAIFSGEESRTALLSNPQPLVDALGEPSTSLEPTMAWIAHWIRNGGRFLDKPTHFEVRDGHY